nr:hypothetical protein [candidate division Zixibacteria bacterium]
MAKAHGAFGEMAKTRIPVDTSKSRLVVSIVYAVLIGFLLLEKFLAEYYFHKVDHFSWPTYKMMLPLALILPSAIAIVFFSFIYGVGSISKPPKEEVKVEIVYTLVTLYLAYVVGIFQELPFASFLEHTLVFLFLVLCLHLLYRYTIRRIHDKYAGLLSDWVVACFLLALACFGFYRAVHTYVGPSPVLPSLWQLNAFLEYWKDIILYTLLGCALLQGMYRLMLFIEGDTAHNYPRGTRVTIVGCYFTVVVISIVLFFGVGDLLYLGSARYGQFNTYQQEVVRTHIYLRDFTLLFFIVLNSAWVMYRLMIVYPRIHPPKKRRIALPKPQSHDQGKENA